MSEYSVLAFTLGVVKGAVGRLQPVGHAVHFARGAGDPNAERARHGLMRHLFHNRRGLHYARSDDMGLIGGGIRK